MSTGKRSPRIRQEILALVGALLMAGLADAASAGTITFYTDRATWLAAASTAGLVVTTEDFSVEPTGLPDLTVGGVDFTLTPSAAPYDSTNERIGYTGGGGNTLGFDITAASVPLFGFGLDLGPIIGNLRTTDVDGASLANGTSGAAGHFIGLLGTAALDPANPFPSNSALSGTNEFGTSGLGAAVYFDNLSVATAVPEPGSLLLVALGLAGLSRWRR